MMVRPEFRNVKVDLAGDIYMVGGFAGTRQPSTAPIP